MTRTLVAAGLLVVLASFNGCTCGGGGGTDVTTTTKSCGEELSDLKRALDEGAITQAEYDRMREATMKRCD